MARVLAVSTREGLFHSDSEQPVAFPGQEVNHLAHGPTGSLWAVVERKHLWKATPEWSHVSSADRLTLNCALPLQDDVLVGASEGHLLRLVEGELEVVRGVEEAEGREAWYTPWGGPPDVRSLSADGAVYANVHVGGILRSDEAGRWSQVIDIHSDVHEVLAMPGGLVLAATAKGLAISRDSGESWEFDDAGLHATYCRAVTLCEDVVLVSAAVGPHGGRAAVYRRPLDASGPLEKCSRGLPEWFGDNIDTGCLTGADGAVALGTSDGRVFLSEDCGDHWTGLAGGLPEVLHVSFVDEQA
jgi:hypothetical protein